MRSIAELKKDLKRCEEISKEEDEVGSKINAISERYYGKRDGFGFVSSGFIYIGVADPKQEEKDKRYEKETHSLELILSKLAKEKEILKEKYKEDSLGTVSNDPYDGIPLETFLEMAIGFIGGGNESKACVSKAVC